MITLEFAYNKLRKRIGDKYIIVDGFELKDAYVFSIADSKYGTTGYPYFSVKKADGSIGGYNPIVDLDEYLYAIENKGIDISALDKDINTILERIDSRR